MLYILDAILDVFHITLILINLFGWISVKTLKLTVFVQCSTLISWFGLGVVYGWGYCFITDWHWQIKYNLGVVDLPHSYTKLLADKIFNANFPSNIVDQLTIGLFFFACLCSVVRIIILRK
jgi:hypothetical protein